MKQEKIDAFNKVNKQAEEELNKDYKNASLDKVIELYSDVITNSYFDDENLNLRDKINILVNQLAVLIYNHTIYDEKVMKNAGNSNKYWNITLYLTGIFILSAIFALKIPSIILAISTLLSLTIGISNTILGNINNNKYEKNNLYLQYVSNLLKGATLELKREEDKDVENVNDLTETVKDTKYAISYTFNEKDIDIQITENETNDIVGNYKLTRHK